MPRRGERTKPAGSRALMWALGAIAALLAAFIVWRIVDHRLTEDRAREQREARERREERRERARDGDRARRVRRESAELVPEELEGVALGMTQAEVREHRPTARPDERTSTEPDIVLLTEQLANGARVVYAFARATDRLTRIQILSQLPSMEAIAPHLAAMNARYGAPSGAWDCPDTGGVPTRRFTWRRAYTTVSDVFLVYGDRVSVTLYVAPSEVIERSLALGSCRPIRDRAELERFPVASPEQMGAVP